MPSTKRSRYQSGALSKFRNRCARPPVCETFATHVGAQTILSTTAAHASDWTVSTYALIHEYQAALIRERGASARHRAGAVFILIASDLIESAMGSEPSWEYLDVRAAARAAGVLLHPAAVPQCITDLTRFGCFLADTGRLSESKRRELSALSRGAQPSAPC